jgi:hypothetical protein
VDGATDGTRSGGSVAAGRSKIGFVKRLLAVLLGGLGLGALLRRRSSGALSPSHADDLRAKLAESKVEPESEPQPEPGVDDRRADVHARGRQAIDDLKD